MSDDVKRTAEHYTKQWGGELNFKEFVEKNPEAAKVMPARQLPWQALFDKIRERAQSDDTVVYDAACGFGDILRSLTADPNPARLQYVGADIHGSLDTIVRPANARLVTWDISNPLPGSEAFDYVVCRAAIHHTPDPAKTFRALVAQLKPGGTIAITAYAKKSPMREAVDTALRDVIVPMSNDEAFASANAFTQLGRDLQASEGKIEIKQDIPLLGIKAGSYGIQQFIYNHFMKCWHNPAFSERHCDLVNFDWYHPPFAYRYEIDELVSWGTSEQLSVALKASTEAQHYLEFNKAA